MKTLETNHRNNWLEHIRRWKSTITWLNTRVPSRFIFPLFSVCVGAKYENGWGGHIGIHHADTNSLFYNGALFIRIMLPFFIGLQIRWAGKDPSKREYMQTYVGIKLNGEWAMLPRFRIQSDNSAAKGTTGPNYGQAIGWNAGTK